MEEIWKDIVDYEGLYQISNLGQVKSLNYNHTSKEKFLKCSIDKLGYKRVRLYNNKKSKTFQVHRLVALMFIPNPENKPFINHIDCNPSNNRVDNLDWCTQKENMEYASKLGRMSNNFKNVSSEQRRINGKKAGCKPCIAINIKTGEKIQFESIREAARKLNIKQPNIQCVLKNKYKTIKGYTFKYAKED